MSILSCNGFFLYHKLRLSLRQDSLLPIPISSGLHLDSGRRHWLLAHTPSQYNMAELITNICYT